MMGGSLSKLQASAVGKADNCIVADDNGHIIGAVWIRIMNDYGHVDDDMYLCIIWNTEVRALAFR